MRPIILDFKVSRREADFPAPYSYSFKESLNIVAVDDAVLPFIDLGINNVEQLTKTKVRRESDDQNFMLELGTKTEVARERDDYHEGLLEMESKTLVARERDDRHDDVLEMMTKTRIYREQDDNHFVNYQ